MARKKKEEVSNVSDAVLKLVNQVKRVVSDINESGVEHLTYTDISKLAKAFDAVVEEANLKHQQHKIDHGEDKGTVMKAWYKDLVRADHPDRYKGNDDD